VKIECHVDPEKQCKRFVVEGELDVHHVKTLKSQVMDAMEEGAWVYRIDMAKIEYLDSSGLGMLVYLKKEVLRHGGSLRIDNLRETVLNVFRLTKLDEFFELT
jgi:anti-sigma B factor antagonist